MKITPYLGRYFRPMAAKVLYLAGICLFIIMLRVFVFEFYQVESSSMEDTFLEGDVLWLNKLSYGARLPIRPADVPFFEAAAYFMGFQEWTQTTTWDYQRLPGTNGIVRNDIVIFTDPHNSKLTLIKRCVALPGDTFEIKQNNRYANGIQQMAYPTEKFSFTVGLKGDPIPVDTLARYGIHASDALWQGDRSAHVSMTWREVSLLKKCSLVDTIFIDDFPPAYPGVIGPSFPVASYFHFTFENYGPLVIPAREKAIKLDTVNIAFYKEIIENYEHNQLDIDDGKIRINDVVTDSYTFKMDYFFMMGDSRYHSLDSRQWGFVPESAIIGTVGLLCFSYNMHEQGFAKIRQDRTFKSINE